MPKPDDVFKDELPAAAAAAAGMSSDDDLGMAAFGLSALATPSGSVSAASVNPRLTSVVNGELLASTQHDHTGEISTDLQ